MELKLLNQYLLVSTFAKVRNVESLENFNVLIKKAYLNTPISDTTLGFYTYSDALVSVMNKANIDEKQDLINKILSTTDEYIIKDIKSNPPFAEYVMVFFNYLYFDLYFGTEKLTNPKKIKSFIRNEKLLEFKDFKNKVIHSLGMNSPISQKIVEIYDITSNLNYKSVIEFTDQVDKIVNNINFVFKTFIDLRVVPYLFIFKTIYLPYKGLIYRITGDKESKEAQNFNFLAIKTLLSLNSYNHLYELLETIKIEETTFDYLKQLGLTDIKVSNLAELVTLMCHVIINESDAKLSNEEKQILYLFYKDVEILIWEYIALIEYLI